MKFYRVKLIRQQEIEVTVPAEDEEDAIYCACQGQGKIVSQGDFEFADDREVEAEYAGDYFDCPEWPSFTAKNINVGE